MNIVKWAAVAIAPAAMIAGFVTAGPVQAAPSPTAQICGAARAVHARATLASENALMTAVMRNPWVKYLSADATSYYSDARGLPASAKYFAKDWSYLAEDGC
jgi:hypothetical protein